jgi:DNA-binding transcriptional ArsR family regulator
MPLEVIEASDPITDLIQFRTSEIYEMMLSLQVIHTGQRHVAWAQGARQAMGEAFVESLSELYAPLLDGIIFYELAVDYPDDDVPGLIDYTRKMDPHTFVFYALGRLFSPEEIAQTGLVPSEVKAMVESFPDYDRYHCLRVPLDWVDDVRGLQYRLADLWETYWEQYFSQALEELRPYWLRGLREKEKFLMREGGQALFEHVTGMKNFPPQIPENQPYEEIIFIPLYLIPRNVFMFYGYGKIIVLFDCERTEARIAEIERTKDEVLQTLRGLGDENRLKILRLIAHAEGQIHGKKIAHRLDLSPATVSRHLAQLKDGNLISEESLDKRTIVYRLKKETLTALPDVLMDYLYS